MRCLSILQEQNSASPFIHQDALRGNGHWFPFIHQVPLRGNGHWFPYV